MDFGFSPDQVKLRSNVRSWMEENISTEWRELHLSIIEHTDVSWEMALDFERKLAAQGWYAPAYPEKYGGIDATVMENAIIKEIKTLSGAPISGRDQISVDYVGNTIAIMGTPEQKEKYLRRIGTGEFTFCLGYSEPGAGSDLASLKTSAIQQGEDIILTGQKIYTTLAHRADYCFCAVRTDPTAKKHAGISIVIVDMKSPGLTVRPLINILHHHDFNEVFFDDVRVPATNLVGKLNGGWQVLMTALNFERSGIEVSAFTKVNIEHLIKFVKTEPWGDGVLAEKPSVRRSIAELLVENEVSRLAAYRVLSMHEKGDYPTYQTSIAIHLGSQHARNFADAAMDILGPYGLVGKSEESSVLNGRIPNAYLSSLSLGIAGGTLEIQKNIVANLALRLPAG